MRLIQVTQQAHDLQRAAEFIHTCSGCSLRRSTTRQDSCSSISTASGSCWSAARRRRVLYWEVEDVRTSIGVLQGKGVEVVALPHVIYHHNDATLGPAETDEWMAFIRDSEGNTVGLVSRHPPAVVPDAASD